MTFIANKDWIGSVNLIDFFLVALITLEKSLLQILSLFIQLEEK